MDSRLSYNLSQLALVEGEHFFLYQEIPRYPHFLHLPMPQMKFTHYQIYSLHHCLRQLHRKGLLFQLLVQG